jgi:type I restriction enzyme S subunit
MSNGDGLPKGWATAKVREVAIPGGSRNPQREDDGEFQYVDIDALDNTQQKITSPKLLPKSEAPNRARMSIRSGDVVFSLVRPYLKNVAIVPPDLDDQIASTAYCVLRPSNGLSNQFLFHQLLQDSFIHSVPTYGSSPPSARDEEFLDMKVRVAPTNEQRRIVAKIEELFSDLDAGVAALERAKAKLKRYRAAVLKAAVEGKLTEGWRAKHPPKETASQLLARILKERRRKWEETQLAAYAKADKKPPANWKAKYKEPAAPDKTNLPALPEGWCWATLEQVNLAERPMSYGVLQPGDDLADGVPLVRVCDVADGVVAVDKLKRISPAISECYKRTLLRGGEILLTIVGTIGRTAVAPECLRGANTARAVAVIPVSSLISPHYVEMALREGGMRSRLTLAAHEVARKTLNLEDVRVACIPLAPLAEQSLVVGEVERRFSIAQESESQIDANLKRSSRLRQSILKRAFEGKLVPQDLNDEPVSLLLERIRRGQGRKMN